MIVTFNFFIWSIIPKKFNNVSVRRSTFESIERDSRVLPHIKSLIDFLIF